MATRECPWPIPICCCAAIRHLGGSDGAAPATRTPKNDAGPGCSQSAAGDCESLPDDVADPAQTLSAARVQQVATDLRELQNKGAKRLVLDLRQCAVGEPEDGVALADLFLDNGLVTYCKANASRGRISKRMPPR